MARNIKKRIEVNGGEGLWVGLGGALEKLDLGQLPAGPSEVEVVTGEKGVKKMGRVVLRREKAHRGGKTVIVIEGFGEHLRDEEIAGVGKRLRVGCGCGGKVEGRVVEIQGDGVGRVREWLIGEGFEVGGIR
jgi:translation initiation factor 1